MYCVRDRGTCCAGRRPGRPASTRCAAATCSAPAGTRAVRRPRRATSRPRRRQSDRRSRPRAAGARARAAAARAKATRGAAAARVAIRGSPRRRSPPGAPGRGRRVASSGLGDARRGRREGESSTSVVISGSSRGRARRSAARGREQAGADGADGDAGGGGDLLVGQLGPGVAAAAPRAPRRAASRARARARGSGNSDSGSATGARAARPARRTRRRGGPAPRAWSRSRFVAIVNSHARGLPGMKLARAAVGAQERLGREVLGGRRVAEPVREVAVHRRRTRASKRAWKSIRYADNAAAAARVPRLESARPSDGRRRAPPSPAATR